MSNNTDTLLRKFAVRWGCRTIPSHDFRDDKYEDNSKEFLSDLNALLDKLMPTEEECEKVINTVSQGYCDKIRAKSFALGFKGCYEWFRSRMKGDSK